MSSDTGAATFPTFERLNYFHGQLLGARDFRDEQAYVLDKLRLLTRCLHGHGVVCGLVVEPVGGPEDCEPRDPQGYAGARDEARVRITPGVGIDCRGNLLVLPHALDLDLRGALGRTDLRRLERDEAEGLWVSICYCEEPVEPTRPVVTHSCAASEECTHARVRESIRVVVTLDRPADDPCCGSCCGDCDAECLVLAYVAPPPDTTVPAGSVHNEVRRMLSRQRLTSIVGVNWWHGATYGVGPATDLATSGFEVEFSHAVRSDTLRRGVVDVLVYEGGRGNVGDIHYVTGGLEAADGPLTNRLLWRSDSDETFQNGDRVLFRLRGDFILDECCQPVDAENVGGRVPPLPGAVEPSDVQPFDGCAEPPYRPGTWTSGDGCPGGVFESWFYVARDAGEAT